MVEIDGKYIVILGGDGGDYRCEGCASESEVFELLTKEIQNELSFWAGPESDLEEDLKYEANAIMTRGLIDDPDEIMQIWMDWFSPTWWFTVLDQFGKIWFGLMEKGGRHSFTDYKG